MLTNVIQYFLMDLAYGLIPSKLGFARNIVDLAILIIMLSSMFPALLMIRNGAGYIFNNIADTAILRATLSIKLVI